MYSGHRMGCSKLGSTGGPAPEDLGLAGTLDDVPDIVTVSLGCQGRAGDWTLNDTPRPYVVLPGGGTRIRGPVGGPATILARADSTGGRFTLIDNIVPPHQGPPLHVHGHEDEMWFVLEGNFRFKANEELLPAPEGAFVYVPAGTAHCFQNVGDQPARILVMFTPSGMERFFERLSEHLPGPVDPETYRKIAHESGMQLVGPPLTSPD
jgi:mannose-6-phosphate isomerase-like protein (cupin superfamily)